jgi:hypothetical protein
MSTVKEHIKPHISKVGYVLAKQEQRITKLGLRMQRQDEVIDSLLDRLFATEGKLSFYRRFAWVAVAAMSMQLVFLLWASA